MPIYGTTRRGKVVMNYGKVQTVIDDQGEGHLLVGDARDPDARIEDRGELTFTEGGPTGGYWKFIRFETLEGLS